MWELPRIVLTKLVTNVGIMDLQGGEENYPHRMPLHFFPNVKFYMP